MNFCHFTILIIISNLTIGQCRTVTYNNVDYDNRKIQNNQTRKLNEYHSKLQSQDNVGKSIRNSTKMPQLSNLVYSKNHIRNPNASQLLKYLKGYQIRKKNSPYTLAIFKDEKSKGKFPSHTLAIFKPNSDSNGAVEASKGKFPSHTLAIFEPNADSNQVQLSKPFKINLTGDQFFLPEIEEDTREGEVFLNNAVFQDLLANSDADNTYQVDDSFKQEYYTINENEIYSFPSDDSSYFPEPYQFDEQYRDNFTGYPESHQLTSTSTEQSNHFNGYTYRAPTYLPPVENEVILQELSYNNFLGNDTKVVEVKQQHDLFAHYYIGYKFWYAFVVFAIYHTIMLGYFYLVTLVKHYSKFPAALQAAIANSNPRREEICTELIQDSVISSNTKTEIRLSLLIFKSKFDQIWNRFRNNDKLSIEFSGRRLFTLMTWNIPLYFNIYFIIYMTYLVIKSIARHKIKLPHISNDI